MSHCVSLHAARIHLVEHLVEQPEPKMAIGIVDARVGAVLGFMDAVGPDAE